MAAELLLRFDRAIEGKRGQKLARICKVLRAREQKRGGHEEICYASTTKNRAIIILLSADPFCIKRSPSLELRTMRQSGYASLKSKENPAGE